MKNKNQWLTVVLVLAAIAVLVGCDPAGDVRRAIIVRNVGRDPITSVDVYTGDTHTGHGTILPGGEVIRRPVFGTFAPELLLRWRDAAGHWYEEELPTPPNLHRTDGILTIDIADDKVQEIKESDTDSTRDR